MSRFVAVPADAIRTRLREAGFRLITSDRSEEVYERKHNKDAHYSIRVYTSISRGATEVRESGSDAIRVLAFVIDDKFSYPPKTFTVFKQRVFRTGTVEGVLTRTLTRAREAYAVCSERIEKSAPKAPQAADVAKKLEEKRPKPERPARPAKGPTLAEWRAKLDAFLVKELDITDALSREDPYKLLPTMGHAYQTGTSPEAFAFEHFEDALADRHAEDMENADAAMGELEGAFLGAPSIVANDSDPEE